MKYMKQHFTAFALIVALVAAALVSAMPVLSHTAAALDPATAAGGGLKAAGGGASGNGGSRGVNEIAQLVVNILLFILGAIAVIMIVIGGIKYTVSNGDSAQVTSAKNTILYAVVGLVVALVAYAIVNFVIKQFK